MFLQFPTERDKQLPGVPVNMIAEGMYADGQLVGRAIIPDEFSSDCITHACFLENWEKMKR
jgi:hypothetical protein